MKKYSFSWNKFMGSSFIVFGLFWSQYMILGAIEEFARAMDLTNVPSGGSIIEQFLIIAIVGCVLLSIEVKEV